MEPRLKKIYIFFTASSRGLVRLLLNAYFFVGFVLISSASGNQNITITSSATSTTGTWTVTGSSVPYSYTFQPNAATDVSNLNAADIIACLTGSNTILGGGGTPPNTNSKPGNVTILTASTGNGVGTGNVTISQPISATLSNATQLTLTIIAAGSMNVANTISLKGSVGSGPGYPGANLILNSGAGFTITSGSGIQTDGGAGGASGGAGGNAGSITIIATTGNVNLSIGSTAIGGAGGLGGTGGSGGAGGNLILTATAGTATLGNTLNSVGGNGALAGAGGKGGDLTMTGINGATISSGWTSNGGTGGATSGDGGSGGTLTMSAPAGTAAVNNSVTNYGGASTNGNGGNGGSVSLTAFTSTIGVTCNSYGGNGGGTGSGGNGGALSMAAPAGTIVLSNTFNSNGGNAGTTGVGGTGGTWSLTALSTVSVTVACSSNGGNGGSSSGNGGNAGSMTFISSASNVSITNALNANGGSANAGNSNGGNGGTIIVYSATNFSSSNGNDISTKGGNGTGTGSSGSGGNITMTGNAANGGLTTVRTYTTTAGTGGSGTAGTAGTLTLSTGNSVVTTGGSVNDGQSGSGYPTIAVGAAPLVKTGTGIFLLGSTNNSYTGLTTVSSGTLKIGANNALGTNASGTTVSNGATIDINNINYTTTEPLTLTGTGISSLGAMTSSTGTAGVWSGVVTISGGTYLAAAASSTLSISGQMVGSGGFTKVDYGTLSLSATSNSYTGSTTITTGTLQIGAAGVIPDASAIILNGGTLRTNGAFSETMGTLTVNAGSSLTFGSASAHTLIFANSNAISWASAANITVYGWTGTYGAGTTGTTKFIVGSTGNVLTAAQLTKIYFIDGSGFYWSAQTLSTGEIVPSTSATGNTFYAIANGNWNVNTTWSFTPGGTAVASGVFPTSTKNVVISGYTVTLTAAAACNNITLGSSACGLTMATNDLSVFGNLNIVTVCPTISTTGGNIIFDGTNNNSQTFTSSCTTPSLGNVTLTNGANIIATNTSTTISVANFTNASGTSSWVNNTSTTLIVTGALAAPACSFISNGGSSYNFSGTTNSPITVGGLTSNSSGTINLGSKNVTVTNLFSYTSGTVTSTGVISMAAASVVTVKNALTVASLQLGGSGVSSTGGGTLTVTAFDFNSQTSFTQTAGTVTTPTINNDNGPISMAYSGTPTFIYSGSGVIPSGNYYNLTTTTNTKSVTCSSTITVDGVLTNSSGTIVGPATSGQFGRFVNANPVNNIAGTIGSSTTNLSFSGTIQGGTVVGAGTNVLQSSTQTASCTFYTLSTTTLTGYSTCSSGASTSKSFTISGSGLTGSGNVIVTGSTDYEVSTDNVTFGASASYPFASGVITGQPKTVYVRLKTGLSAGAYNSENVTVTAAGGAAAKTLSNSGNVVTGCTITWTGNTNTLWEVSTNWSPTSVPTSIDNAIIPNVSNKPVISASISGNVKDLTINTGSFLTINATGTLNTYGNISNSGTFTTVANSAVAFNGSSAQTITGVTVLYNIIINNTAGVTLQSALAVNGTLSLTKGVLTTNSNLIINFDNGGNIGYASGDLGSISGNVTGQRNLVAKTHYIGVPFSGVTSAQVAAKTPLFLNSYWKLYTRVFATQNWSAVTDLTTAMPVGTGFSLAMPAAASLAFTGTYNHALTFASPSYTNTATGKYIFVGNPYPSTLDWDNASGWTKNNVGGAIYYWDAANTRVASYSSGVGTNGGTRYIPAMQGVLMDLNGSGTAASISINNNARISTQNSTYMRTASDAMIRIRIEDSAASKNDETVIRFNYDATNAFDMNLDAHKFMNGASVPSVYTTSGSEMYSINSYAAPDSAKFIPIAAKLPADGTYRMIIQNDDPTLEYVLVDKKLGVEQTIKQVYTFSGLKADDVNRFELQLRTNTATVTTGVQSANKAAGLYINSTTGSGFYVQTQRYAGEEAEIEIMDVTGNSIALISGKTLTGGITFVPLDLSSGSYLVKIYVGSESFSGIIVLTK